MDRAQNYREQWAGWVVSRVRTTVEAAGLHVEASRPVIAPFGTLLRLRLVGPSANQQGIASMRRQRDAFAAAVGSGVTLEFANGIFILTATYPDERALRSPLVSDLARSVPVSDRDHVVAVGVDAYGQAVQADLEQHGAFLWVGPSRRGKSANMRAALAQLITGSRPGSFEFAIIDPKGEWRQFTTVAGCLGVVGRDEAVGAATWVERQVHGPARSARLLLLVDDLFAVLRGNDGLGSLLDSIASTGAARGIHLWGSTQDIAGDWSAGIDRNASFRVIFKTTDGKAAARASGMKGLADQVAALSGAKGDCLAVIDGKAERIMACWPGDDPGWINSLPRQHGPAAMPWRAQTTVNAPNPTHQLNRHGYKVEERHGRAAFTEAISRARAYNQSQPPTTAYNRPQPVAEGGYVKSTARPQNIYPLAVVGPQLVAQPVVQPPAPQPVVLPVSLPKDGRLTDDVAQVIRDMAAQGASKNLIQRQVFGFKDGRTAELVNGVLAGPQAVDETQAQPVDSVDEKLSLLEQAVWEDR